jgi:hypothetical protein
MAVMHQAVAEMRVQAVSRTLKRLVVMLILTMHHRQRMISIEVVVAVFRRLEVVTRRIIRCRRHEIIMITIVDTQRHRRRGIIVTMDHHRRIMIAIMTDIMIGITIIRRLRRHGIIVMAAIMSEIAIILDQGRGGPIDPLYGKSGIDLNQGSCCLILEHRMKSENSQRRFGRVICLTVLSNVT